MLPILGEIGEGCSDVRSITITKMAAGGEATLVFGMLRDLMTFQF
ncbi:MULTISPECIES: hypothetical protein [unclassified Microcoleus]